MLSASPGVPPELQPAAIRCRRNQLCSSPAVPAWQRNPLFPLNKTAAVINMDMIGRTDRRHTEKDTYVYAINRKDHNKLKRANKQNGKVLGVDVDFTPGLGKRLVLNLASDHRPFVVRDVPSMILTTGDHPDYHTPADDTHKISYNRAAAIARLAFLNAWTLANE